MDGRHHRAPWVHDQAHPGSVEQRLFPTADPSAEPLRRRRGQRAAHDGAVDACLLEGGAFAQHSRDAAATAGPIPAVLAEPFPAVEPLEERRGLVVQPLDQPGDPVANRRLAHGPRHSLTASTNARACATGTSGWMPCPRLAMCPHPPNAASMSVGARTNLFRSSVEPARIEIPLERHGTAGQAAARVRRIRLPVDADDVGGGRVRDLLQRPARARRERDDGRAGGPGQSDRLDQVGERELPEVARAQGARP